MFLNPIDLTSNPRTMNSALEIAIRARETEKRYMLLNEVENSHKSTGGKFRRFVKLSVHNFLSVLFA